MSNVNPERFVAAWLSEQTVADVAKCMGMRHDQAKMYAIELRRLGVKLPRKNASDSRPVAVPVAALNEMIAKVGG